MTESFTPMMRQYLEMKEKYKDCLLFYRLGDFYEMFFEDAKVASRELELTLTGRDCGLKERAPMCGVPYHSVDVYVAKLISRGYKVAICEQMQDPALAKGLVERDVIRIITPGTVIEDRILDEDTNNYIVCISYTPRCAGIAYADVSTGCFYAGELTGARIETQISDELARLRPSQVLGNEGLYGQEELIRQIASAYYTEKVPESTLKRSRAEERLCRHFSVASLDGFGLSGFTEGISAAGALLSYLEETQKNSLSHINRIRLLQRSGYMVLDSSTRRNLELSEPLRYGGSKKSTLCYHLDETQTAMGGRMLRDWIDRPLQNIDAINGRLVCVEALKENAVLRSELKEMLRSVYDMERLCSKVVYGTVNPRDCVALRTSVGMLPGIREKLLCSGSEPLHRIAQEIDPMIPLWERLKDLIGEDVPPSVKEGGFIRKGYSKEIDELREIQAGSRQWITDMEQAERARTGIRTLRIGYNKVFGYYIEVSKSFAAQVPYEYERKQTLVNGERYITPELKETERKILSAGETQCRMEYDLFMELREELLGEIEKLQKNAAVIARLDILNGFAGIAASRRYCKPLMTDDGCIRIKAGRHPVVENAMNGDFIPNDVLLDGKDNRLLIITGPNMAGKSTYMRQIALITLMAHVGCFVPAEEAQICLVDRIFTRVGASDDVSAGQSTFMVEMSEMANILNNATPKSLLLLDEIGRGTSTYDGLSIAQAVLEHIASERLLGAKTLFATHYHELTELREKLEGVQNCHISVKEIGHEIIFLRKIVPGGTDKSFGIQVARLAGIPDIVLDRAEEILETLHAEQTPRKSAGTGKKQQPLFLMETGEKADKRAAMVAAMLEDTEVEQLTPMEAINRLYHLKQLLREDDR